MNDKMMERIRMKQTRTMDLAERADKLSRKIHEQVRPELNDQVLDVKTLSEGIGFVYAHHKEQAPVDLTGALERAYAHQIEYLAKNPYPNGNKELTLEHCAYRAVAIYTAGALMKVSDELIHKDVVESRWFWERLAINAGALVWGMHVDATMQDHFQKESRYKFDQLKEAVENVEKRYGGQHDTNN